MMLSLILEGLAWISGGLVLWQYWAGMRFPLGRRPSESPSPFAPSVTILKPLKGRDEETEACLSSWLQQDYPGEIQILFGVADPADPVCRLVKGLLPAAPPRQAELLICSKNLGPNAKVSTLAQLFELAKHEIIVISDADVWAPPHFLADLMEPLRQPEVGLVNCLYRLAGPKGLPMQWEAIAINADFWSQVLQSTWLKPLDFALGAVMTARRSLLTRAGGFVPLLHYLADDFCLGRRIAETGARVVLSTSVAECREPAKSWKEVWFHQLRWARTIRHCQPAPYFFSILSNGSLWPLAWMAANPTGAAVLVGSGFLALRIGAAFHLQARFTGSYSHWKFAWLVPVKDLLAFAIWAGAFLGNKIVWRQNNFRVSRNGKLVPVAINKTK